MQPYAGRTDDPTQHATHFMMSISDWKEGIGRKERQCDVNVLSFYSACRMAGSTYKGPHSLMSSSNAHKPVSHPRYSVFRPALAPAFCRGLRSPQGALISCHAHSTRPTAPGIWHQDHLPTPVPYCTTPVSTDPTGHRHVLTLHVWRMHAGIMQAHHPPRAACTLYVLWQASKQGHCFMHCLMATGLQQGLLQA